MTRKSYAGFHDAHNGRVVYVYRDKLGRRWLAQSRWGLFRVQPRVHRQEIHGNRRRVEA